jgi:hypothetical protein
MLVSDLLTTSLTTIGAVAGGETPATEDYTLAQTTLNNLIGSWNAAVKKSLAVKQAEFAKALALALTDIQKAIAGPQTDLTIALADYDPSVFTVASTLSAAVAQFVASATVSTTVAFVPVPVTVNLTDTLTLPNGWPRALGFNVALDLCEPYGKPATATLVNLAALSKAEIITPATPPQAAPNV